MDYWREIKKPIGVFRSCWNNSFVFHIWKKGERRKGRRTSYDICGFPAHPKCHCSWDLLSWKILDCLHPMPSNCLAPLTAGRPDVLCIRELSSAFKHQLLRLNLPPRGCLGSKTPHFCSPLPEMTFHQARELQPPNSRYQDKNHFPEWAQYSL